VACGDRDANRDDEQGPQLDRGASQVTVQVTLAHRECNDSKGEQEHPERPWSTVDVHDDAPSASLFITPFAGRRYLPYVAGTTISFNSRWTSSACSKATE
jgi:hypothetical protein